MRRAAAALLSCAALAAACADGRPRGPISAGERLYLAKCTSCHSAYAPSKYTAKQWHDNVHEMEGAKKVTLSPDERAEILTYLTGSPTAK